jgi:hypothetical protein
MKNRRIPLSALLSMALVLTLIPPALAAGASATVLLPDDHSIIHSTLDSSSLFSTTTLNVPTANTTPKVAAGGYNTLGVESDGTVIATGYNDYGQCNVSGWTDIIQVATDGYYHTVGLKANGTVVAVGWCGVGMCNVGGWTDIVQVATGGPHTVGLRSDGTVVAAGSNEYGQCNVSDWTDIIQVAAGYHTVGLRSDGTVVAKGYNVFGQCNVSGWTDIVQVAAGHWHTMGLKANGTVVAVGYNGGWQCDVGGWTGIIQVCGGEEHTVGLKADGTVVATLYNRYDQGNVSDWMGITQVAAGYYHTVGLRADGTVVAVGDNSYGQCDVGGWDLGVVQSECIATVTNAGNGCFTPSDGTIHGLHAVPAPSPLPHGVRLPYGMFTFRIIGLTPGQSVTLTVEFPDPIPTHWVWWKYHNNTWSRLPIGRTTDPRIITVTLTDNVPPGDEDSILGQITDQGGPGNPGSVGWQTYPIDKMRVLLPWIALLAAVTAGASLLAVRRRRSTHHPGPI